MVIFFLDLAVSLLGYIILACSFLGFGWQAARLLRIDFSPSEAPFPLIWLGWAFVLLLLQIQQLFAPITVYSSFFLLVIGMISFCIWLTRRNSDHNIFPLPRIYLLLLTGAVLWVATLSMNSPAHYDSGLYHFNAIRWLNESPIVLGLGNLDGRLAFNQSFFAYVAFLNLHPLFNHGYNIANSFLLMALLAEYLLCFSKWTARKCCPADVFQIFLLPALVYIALNSYLSSPSPDAASSILQILIFTHFIRDFDEDPSIQSDHSRLIFIFIISATAITVKLSNLFYVLSICIILLLVRLKSLHLRPYGMLLPKSVRIAALPALIILVWAFRGILTSGCPAYPSTFGCINTSWSVPVESAEAMSKWIYSWARLPGESPDQVLGSWTWLRPWLHNAVLKNKGTVVYPLSVSILGMIACVLIHIRSSMSREKNWSYLLFPLPVLVGLLVWFFLAPDVRFANSLFWILPVAVMVSLIRVLEPLGKTRTIHFIVIFFIINAYMLGLFVRNPQTLIKLTKGYASIPVMDVTEKRTASGLVVLVPVDGIEQCWNSDLPCTPYFNAALTFVDRGLFAEFAIDQRK